MTKRSGKERERKGKEEGGDTGGGAPQTEGSELPNTAPPQGPALPPVGGDDLPHVPLWSTRPCRRLRLNLSGAAAECEIVSTEI